MVPNVGCFCKRNNWCFTLDKWGWSSCAFFQRIYLIGFADNVSKERQNKGYCLISNESNFWKCALDYWTSDSLSKSPHNKCQIILHFTILQVTFLFHSFFIHLGTPKGLDFKEVMEDLQNIRAVKMVHNLHIWSLTMGTAALSVHLAIGNPCVENIFKLFSCS